MYDGDDDAGHSAVLDAALAARARGLPAYERDAVLPTTVGASARTFVDLPLSADWALSPPCLEQWSPKVLVTAGYNKGKCHV